MKLCCIKFTIENSEYEKYVKMCKHVLFLIFMTEISRFFLYKEVNIVQKYVKRIGTLYELMVVIFIVLI